MQVQYISQDTDLLSD